MSEDLDRELAALQECQPPLLCGDAGAGGAASWISASVTSYLVRQAIKFGRDEALKRRDAVTAAALQWFDQMVPEGTDPEWRSFWRVSLQKQLDLIFSAISAVPV